MRQVPKRVSGRVAVTLAAVGLALALASCQASMHSGIEGSLSPDTSASTDLTLPSTTRSIALSGRVTLTSGSASVTFTSPAGVARTMSFLKGPGSGPDVFQVGPLQLGGTTGLWSAKITADPAAHGSYVLSIDAP